MTKKILWLALLVLILAGIGLYSAGGGTPPQQHYLIGDPQGDWGFPSPFAHNPRGPGYLRVSFLFDTLIWKDAKGFIPGVSSSLRVPFAAGSYLARWQTPYRRRCGLYHRLS